MNLLLLPGIVAAFLLVTYRAFRRRYPQSRLKAGGATIVLFLLVFTGDHLLGYAHAHWWVRAVPVPPIMPVVADHIAFEYDDHRRDSPAATEAQMLRDYAVQMVSAEHWGSTAGLLASYSRLQGVITDVSGRKIFNLAATADEATCSSHLTPQEQIAWRARAAVALGPRARCVSIIRADALQAGYLLRLRLRAPGPLQTALGVVGTITVSSLSDTVSGKTIAESRHLSFAGGWVKRAFFIPITGARTGAAPFVSPYPPIALQPATPQRVP